MREIDREAHELCELGLQAMWEGEVDAALDAYGRAFAVAESDDVRELIAIRKAEALIACDREGAEVSALPGIVLRRRSPRHVYLAAYALMRKFSEANERQRALFYGQIASKASDELAEPLARANVHNGLGVILAAESKLRDAVEAFEKALTAIAFVADQDSRILALRAGITANLGGTKVLMNSYEDGIALIESAIDRLDTNFDRAEGYLDLAVGYLGVEKYEVARRIALLGLDLASTRRQVRNANHLLGEICVRTNRYDEADKYFDVVAGFYPDFANVKQLLIAVDLCSVVNWKA
jgi:tetratricopeptide (TPR) repeat protein